MPLTALELYTRVRSHLLAQSAVSMGTDSVTGKPALRYYGTHGRKCAIGCLIPEAVYSEAFEGCPVGRLPEAVVEATGLTKELLPLAIALQKLHDWTRPGEWGIALDKIAERFGLAQEPGLANDDYEGDSA